MILGKDGRELSYFQSPEWMKKIFKERGWDTMPKGEKNVHHKVTEKWVRWLRGLPSPITRERMRKICSPVNLNPSYGYHLRNPNMKKWEHLR